MSDKPLMDESVVPLWEQSPPRDDDGTFASYVTDPITGHRLVWDDDDFLDD